MTDATAGFSNVFLCVLRGVVHPTRYVTTSIPAPTTFEWISSVKIRPREIRAVACPKIVMTRTPALWTSVARVTASASPFSSHRVVSKIRIAPSLLVSRYIVNQSPRFACPLRCRSVARRRPIVGSPTNAAQHLVFRVSVCKPCWKGAVWMMLNVTMTRRALQTPVTRMADASTSLLRRRPAVMMGRSLPPPISAIQRGVALDFIGG